MELKQFLQQLKHYGVGPRKLDDELFARDKAPVRLGVYDLDEENLCHEVIKSTCNVPGCTFTAESLLEFEGHYNSSHRYACSQCKRVLPSPHLLDLHIQETHDSFFAAMAERRPSYCCYIEECKEKFKTPEERLEHCVTLHKLPKDFRFEQRQRKSKKQKAKPPAAQMEVDSHNSSKEHKFAFTNSKNRGFVKYTGKKFTKNKHEQTLRDVNMDEIIDDLKANLPE